MNECDGHVDSSTFRHDFVHSMDFPTDAIGPSNANVGLASNWHAIVVSNPFLENTLLWPVTVKTEPDSSNVILVTPRRRHPCPTTAACRSPITPVIGTPASGPSANFPYTSELVLISGRQFGEMSKSFNSDLSHFSVLMFIKNVLDAFVESVANTPPAKVLDAAHVII